MNSHALPQPSTIGLRASFGFGDRLGLATAGHIAACRKGGLIPIFAQQSVRELTRTQRTPEDVMRAAQESLHRAGWSAVWGADADHLKTREDVLLLAAAGYTFFTIDPSAFVQNQADHLVGQDLEHAAAEAVRSGGFDSLSHLESLYLGKRHDLAGSLSLAFTEKEALYRAVVKYGKAVAHAEQMARWIAQAARPGHWEIEVSVDETDTPTSPLEHLFIAMEFRRRHVNIISLAPRFVGEFEKGIDYRGDLAVFESALRRHVAVARHCGPYKVCVHSGSDKFKIYPILGRVCGDFLHVKTAGTSYLEALRVAARQDPPLFLEMIHFARAHFEADRATYHISARLDHAPSPETLSPKAREAAYLDKEAGRQILHVTFGSVLTAGRTGAGRSMKEALLETLNRHAALHAEVVARHLGKHIELLSAG